MDIEEYEEKAPEVVTDELSLIDRSDEATSQTQTFPAELPQQYPYELEEYYVRECYPTYYELNMCELFKNDKDCVTITGAPGNRCCVVFTHLAEQGVEVALKLTSCSNLAWNTQGSVNLSSTHTSSIVSLVNMKISTS